MINVGVVGLGLIGGSFAKAYKKAGNRVLAFDKDKSVLDFAVLCGVADGVLTAESMRECDIILVAIYPEAAIEFVTENAESFGKNPVVIDCCGTKRKVCDACFALAEKHGFTFVGGHPMAGRHTAGFKHSKEDMFVGAPMVIVPPDFNDIELLVKIKELLAPAGFGSFSVTDAEKHDEMIAFTSQLAHVVSNAYIKSPTAGQHEGFSAGSYKDMTRVAWLEPLMWAQLFMENKDFLINEIDTLTDNLQKYKTAMLNGDKATLIDLLDEGRKLKQKVDGIAL